MSEYLNPLAGGILIGLASTIMLAALGRITGISGIFSSLLSYPKIENTWKYYFILGLILGGFIMKALFPDFFNFKMPVNIYLLIGAGLLVGYGTRLGSGCTSGHGVCGMPRLSKRSIIATMTFMGAGVITVAIMGVLS